MIARSEGPTEQSFVAAPAAADREPLLTAHLALGPATPATARAGCVQLLPGSHKLGLLNPGRHSGLLTEEQVAPPARHPPRRAALRRTPPHRTAPRRTAPHRTAPHRTALLAALERAGDAARRARHAARATAAAG